MADPGFPVGGGVDLVGGGVDSRGGYVLKILYVKTKELGPLGGSRAGRAPLDPPMQKVLYLKNTMFCNLIAQSRKIPQNVDLHLYPNFNNHHYNVAFSYNNHHMLASQVWENE